MEMSTSLRLPVEVKQRVARLAVARATTPHAFMVEAIEEKVQAEEAHSEFVAEATRRLAKMKRLNRGIPAAEVFRHLLLRSQGKKSKRPVARKLK